MSADIAQFKSCGPQLFAAGEPDMSWGLEELGRYANHHDRLIIEAEKSVTANYWRLGLALQLAKLTLNHGQSVRFLAQWGIDKTRASKSRAIYGAFENEEGVCALTVEQAYSHRKRRKRKGAIKRNQFRQAGKSFLCFLRRVSSRAEQFIDEAAFAEPDEAAQLLDPVADAIENLTKIQEWLQGQVRTSKASGQLRKSPRNHSTSHARVRRPNLNYPKPSS